MSAPTHCPKCGFEIEHFDDKLVQGSFKCGSEIRAGMVDETRNCLRNQLAVCKARIAELNKDVDLGLANNMSLIEENTRLRAALAQSPGACHYCQLPKEQWSLCKSGFPGCSRLDYAMGCPEYAASMMYGDLVGKCATVVKRWRDPARENWFVGAAIEELAGEIGYRECDAK